MIGSTLVNLRVNAVFLKYLYKMFNIANIMTQQLMFNSIGHGESGYANISFEIQIFAPEEIMHPYLCKDTKILQKLQVPEFQLI